jgi:hypothetical protein
VLLLFVVLAVSGCIVSIPTTPTASPPPSPRAGDANGLAYAAELAADGIHDDGPTAAYLATTICTARASVSHDDLVNQYVQHGRTAAVANDIIHGAEFHFCPEHLSSTTTSTNGH